MWQPGEQIEGECQERVACENCRRFIKCAVHGRLAAPQVIIVHRWQIVMDERIAMDTFDSGGGVPDRFIIAAEQARGFCHQKGPQPFAARQRGMAHGGHQARWAGNFARNHIIVQQLGQQGVHARRRIGEAQGEGAVMLLRWVGHGVLQWEGLAMHRACGPVKRVRAMSPEDT